MSNVPYQNLITSELLSAGSLHSMYSSEHGMPQAMLELAQTYLMVRNFSEAMEWALALAENPRLIPQAEVVLLQVIDNTPDVELQATARVALAELQAKKLPELEQTAKHLREKASFLVHVE
jgi:hypothetical protein